MELQVPVAVQTLLSALRQAGFEAYAVGGCVRDALLQKQPHDWDLTTSALPEEMKTVFAGYPLFDIGAQHGTIGVRIDHQTIEVTTFRIDGSYEDNRHPNQVQFTGKLAEDLSRRDFTVNAMAYSGETGLVDLFGGQEDLAAKRIRCVGNPDRRFREDALRLLRAVRFASVLSFQVEPETAAAIERNQNLLCHISAERITAELHSFLNGPGAGRLLLQFAGLFGVALPGITLTEEIGQTVDRAPEQFPLRLALLLTSAVDPEAALCHLRLSNAEKDAVLALLQHRTDPLPQNTAEVRILLFRLGPERCRLLADFHQAQGADVTLFRSLLQEVLERKDCYRIRDLALDGNQLQKLGCPPGPQVGQLLERLLLQVMEEKIENTRSALTAAALKEIS